MSEPSINKAPNFLDKIKYLFQTDFLKWSLLSIWLITIFFTLILNLFIAFNPVKDNYIFKAFDITKIWLEIVISIPLIIAIVSLLIKKRSLAEKIGTIVSSIIIYEAVFLNVYYNVYSSASSGQSIDPSAGWVIFKSWLLGILNLVAIIMILIDTRKTKKEAQQQSNNKDIANKKIEHQTQKPIETEKKNENIVKDKPIAKDEPAIKTEPVKKEENIQSKPQNKNADTHLSNEDLDALDELSKFSVVDNEKDSEEEEIKNLNKE